MNIEEMVGLTQDARNAIAAALLLTGIMSVIATWVKTRSMAPTLAALLLAGLVLWMISRDDKVVAEIDQDVRRHTGYAPDEVGETPSRPPGPGRNRPD